MLPKKPEKKLPRQPDAVLRDLVAAKLVLAPRDVDHKLAEGRSVQIARAQRMLDAARAELRAVTVPLRPVALLASGDADSIQAARAFLLNNGGLVLDVGALWDELCSVAVQSLGREWGALQHDHVCNELRRRARLAGLEFDWPTFHGRSKLTVVGKAGVPAHARELANNACPRLARELYSSLIVQQVEERSLEAKRIPMLVVGWNEVDVPDVAEVSFRAVKHEFAPGWEPTQEAIVDILKPKR